MQDYQDYFDYEDEQSKELRTFLEFVVSGKIVAIETFQVVEIVQLEEVTPVPEFPEYVKGLITVNGRTIAVIDTTKRFRYPEDNNIIRRCVIICTTSDGKEIGLLADDVLKIRNVDKDKVAPPPEVNREAFTRYITGMFLRTSGEPCFIVSPELMMSEDELSMLPSSENSEEQD